MTKTQNERSKHLSYLLRHRPEAANLDLDKEGWCSIQQLTENTDFTVDELFTIVREDKKQRYSVLPSFSEALQTGEQPTEIRANQGHSTHEVDITFKVAVPPVKLYHGADSRALAEIQKLGLLPMRRHHVHLSADVHTAEAVGGRRRSGHAVLEVDAKAMVADGIKFYISDNNVWLVDAVPPKYLKELP